MGQKVIQRHPETGGVHKVTEKQAAQVYEPRGWTTVGPAADAFPEDLRTVDEAGPAAVPAPVDEKAAEAEKATAEAVQAADEPKKTAKGGKSNG